MEKKSFILSWVAICISLITLAVIFVRVTPNSVVNIGTFIGVIAAFIGIIVTFLVGFQIYNAMEIQHKLSKIDNLYNELIKTNKFISYLKDDVYTSIFSVAANASHVNPLEQHNAFLYINMSLQHALNLDLTRQSFIFKIEEVEKYALDLNTGDRVFCGTSKQVQENVDAYIKMLKPIMTNIKKHTKYHLIADRYDRLFQAFEARMEKIRNSIPASITNIYDDL